MMTSCELTVRAMVNLLTNIDYNYHYKGTSIDPKEITPKLLMKIFKGEEDPLDFFKTSFGSYKFNNGKILFNTIDKFKDNELADISDLFNEEELNKAGIDIKQLVIGLHQVLASIQEYQDIANKKNINSNELNKVQSDNGRFYIKWNHVAKVIGQLYIEANGKKAKEANIDELTQIYIKVGEPVLKYLQEKGYIDFHENVYTLLNEERTDTDVTQWKLGIDSDHRNITELEKAFTLGSKISDLYIDSILDPEKVNDKKYQINKFKKLDEETGNRIYDITKYEKDYTEEDKHYLNNAMLSMVVSKLSQLTIPRNITHYRSYSIYDNPKIKRADGTEISLHDLLKKRSDMSLSGIVEEATKLLEEKPYYLNEMFIDTIKGFLIQYQVATRNGDSIYKYIYDNNIDQFLELDPDTEIPQTLEEINQKQGSNRTRLDNFILIMDALNQRLEEEGKSLSEITNEEFGKFYIGKFRGANARMYNAENQINFETDKYLSRQFTNLSAEPLAINLFDSSGSISLGAKYVFTQLLHESLGVKEHEDIIIDYLLNPNLDYKVLIETNNITNKKVQRLLKMINTFRDIDTLAKKLMINRADVTTYVNSADSYFSPIQLLKLHQFVRDVSNIKDNKLSTHIMPELDANSSGVTLKILDTFYSGSENSKQAENLLYRFGMIPKNGKFIKTDDPEYLKGPYEYILEKLHNIFDIDIKVNGKQMSKDAIFDTKRKMLKDLVAKYNLKRQEEANKKGIDYYETKIDEKMFKFALNLWNEYIDPNGYRDIAKKPTMVIGAYNMDPISASKTNVAEELYSEFKKEWIKSPTRFKEFLKLYIDSGNKITDTQLIKFVNEETELNSKQIATILKNRDTSIHFKSILHNSLGKILSFTAYNEFTQGLFKENNEVMEELWNKLTRTYDPNTEANKSKYRVLDLNFIMSNDLDVNDISTWFNFKELGNSKNYLNLLKRVNVWDSKTQTNRIEQIPNFPTLTVSMIHGYDTMVLHQSILDLKEYVENKKPELKNIFDNTNIMTIHDAVILHPELAPIFQKLYVENTYKIMNKYNRNKLIFNSMKFNVLKGAYSKYMYQTFFKKDAELNPYNKNSKYYIDREFIKEKHKEEIKEFKKELTDKIKNELMEEGLKLGKKVKLEDIDKQVFQERFNKEFGNYMRNLWKQDTKQMLQSLIKDYKPNEKQLVDYLDPKEKEFLDYLNNTLDNLNVNELTDNQIQEYTNKHSGKIFGEPLIEYSSKLNEEETIEPEEKTKEELDRFVNNLIANYGNINDNPYMTEDPKQGLIEDVTDELEKLNLNSNDNMYIYDKILEYYNCGGK